MKNVTLLLALLLISTIGFSQNKIGGDDPIEGIDIIIKDIPRSKPIVNTEKNPLIDRINKLEEIYLEKISENWLKNKETLKKGTGNVSGIRIYFGAYLENKIKDLHQQFEYNFYRIEGHLGKITKNDVFSIYINYLDFKTEASINDQEAAGITGKWFDEYFNNINESDNGKFIKESNIKKKPVNSNKVLKSKGVGDRFDGKKF